MPNNEVAFIDGIVEAIKQILTNGSAMLHQSVQEMMPLAVGVSVRTPYPVPQNGFFFGKPTDEPWISLYSYYSDVVLPITVLLFGVSIGVIMFTGTFGALLTGYEKSKAQRRLFIGFLFILAWWGLGSFMLRFADAIATSIAPDPNSVATAFTSKMSLSGTGMVTRAIMVFAEAIIVIGVVLWFLLRWIGIYALMLAMPIAVALWMAGVGGPLRYLSNLIEELAFKFIPLAFISIPVAVVYRVGDLLFQAYNPAAEFGNPIAPFVLVLGFPLLTLVSSYYVFFKAPSIGIVSRGQAPSSTEREAIQKGRAEVERVEVSDGRPVTGSEGGPRGDGTSPLTGRDGAEQSVERASAGAYSAGTTGGMESRTRSYEEASRTSGARAEEERLERNLERSRRKIRELRENGDGTR